MPTADVSAGDPASTAQLAAALGRIPSGLYLVMWRDGDADRVMLASWVMQAGFEPPAVSIGVERSRDALPFLQRGGRFVLHLLGSDDRGLIGRFAKPAASGAEPFEGLEIERADCGAAVLRSVANVVECRATGSCPSGDHEVIVATVERVIRGNDTVEPAVHIRKNGLRY
jgi:flavin reductase (DIM6/NTAB) family NADH-FMN oxidoreductase RutF